MQSQFCLFHGVYDAHVCKLLPSTITPFRRHEISSGYVSVGSETERVFPEQHPGSEVHDEEEHGETTQEERQEQVWSGNRCCHN